MDSKASSSKTLVVMPDSKAPSKQTKGNDSKQLWSNNFLSNWFYLWVVPIIGIALRSDYKDFKFMLRTSESARINADRLEAAWESELAKKDGKKPSIQAAILSAFGYEYAMIGLYKITWTFFTWAGAWYLLKLILSHLSNKRSDDFNGHMFAMALFVASIFSSIAIHQQYGECNRVGIKVKAAVTALVYRKCLKISRIHGGAGEVINILSTDVTRINDAVVNFHFLWSAIVEVLLILGISFYEIGISALPALGFVLLLLPIQGYLGKMVSDVNRAQTEATTKRVHVMSEILTAIKLIKFYAWETPFANKIEEMRRNEMSLIFRGMMIKSFNFGVVFAIPVLVALTCLSMETAIRKKPSSTTMFTILSVFNTLRYPFLLLPMAIKSTVSALTAFARLDIFLTAQEVEGMKVTPAPAGCDLALQVKDADFRWDGSGSDAATIRNISLSIPKGKKVAIVGDVGCGKSSILAAILGQIRQTRGEKMKVYGSTAYMPQEAWLLNLTLRENVLFGRPMDKALYKEVIRVCSLQRDLTLLLSADQTEIAERGANLSGGQRQRVSLARAVYYDAEIVLLDDPLSAVDNHVGRHIFEECFLKHLKNKTLIVAMNQLQYLSQMDYVIYVNDGAIRAQGTYDYLMENDEKFATMVHSHVADGDAEGGEEIDVGPPMNEKDFELPEPSKPSNKTKEALSVKDLLEKNALSVTSRNQLSIRNQRDINENTIRSILDMQASTTIPGAEKDHDIAKIVARNEMSTYSVSQALKKDDDDDEGDEAAAILKGKLVVDDDSARATGPADFINYFKSGTGIFKTISVVVAFMFVHCIRLGGDFWLRLWGPDTLKTSDAVYIGVYGAFTVAFAAGVVLRGVYFTSITSYKARCLHDDLFDAIIRAPMSFFDSTPVARILSAFSKHQLHVDDTMPDAGMQALQYFPLGLGALIMCSVLIPWNYIPSIGIVAIGYFLLRWSSPADVKTKSLEAVTKPPIYSHVTATLEGLFSVRAYHAQTRFDSMNLVRLDTNHEALFAMQCVKSFQALYFDILSSFVIYFSSVLLVMNREAPEIGAIAGLALSNALQMLVFVQWTVRMWGDVENQMSSVGQLVYYAQTKPEAPFEIPDKKPPAGWPPTGRIEFNDVVLRYQKFGVAVLKNISCVINPGEKIGIVGRTGSGKSTLLVSLLRIVESAEGKITIDGLDVSTLGLHDLRKSVAIIPQEPVMFVGTIRSNLDPFNRCTDEEIWKALDAVYLGDKLRKSPAKLDTPVSENGKSVSQGQRQLICIARAILSKAKVLVLDEATASLDAQTDFLIQEAIKKNFADLTMLTIAHRLNTIIESDRVLVMDAGRIVEFDEPVELLKMENGSFRGLCEQAGEAAFQKLQECADAAHEARVARGYKKPEASGPMTVADIARGAK